MVLGRKRKKISPWQFLIFLSGWIVSSFPLKEAPGVSLVLLNFSDHLTPPPHQNVELVLCFTSCGNFLNRLLSDTLSLATFFFSSSLSAKLGWLPKEAKYYLSPMSHRRTPVKLYLCFRISHDYILSLNPLLVLILQLLFSVLPTDCVLLLGLAR